MKKLDYIDALRGLAILGVVMVHASQYGRFDVPGIVERVVSHGGKGVQLFFFASAFTLFLSYKNRSTREAFPIRNFFLRRFMRIAPIYYLGIAYYLFQNGMGPRTWLGTETSVTPFTILSHLTFTHGFSPTWVVSLVPGGWSIGVEMTFYLLIPLLFAKIRNINQAFQFFVGTLLVKLFLHLFFLKVPLIGDSRLWGKYLSLYFPSQLPIFSLGILFYFMVAENEGTNKISGKSLLAFTGILLLQLATGIQILMPNHIHFGIGFLLLGVALSSYPFLPIVNPVIRHIGKISFSMYIVHFAVLHWLNEYQFVDLFANGLANYLARFALVTGLSVALSTLLYHLVEIPFQNLGKKWIRTWEPTN